jgi:hypothetical protein
VASLPKQNIITHTKQNNCLFFDWLYNDFNCALHVLENIEHPEIVMNPTNFIFKMGSDSHLATRGHIVNTKIKMLSTHDKPVDITFEEYLPKFIEKYTAKMERLKNVIRNNDNFTFILLITPESMSKYAMFPNEPKIMDANDIAKFFATINCIKGNESGNVFLQLVVPLTLEKYFADIEKLRGIDGVKIHYLQPLCENNVQHVWDYSHCDFSKIFT